MAKERRGLGRGLDALLGGTAEETQTTQQAPERVKVSEQAKKAAPAEPKRPQQTTVHPRTISSEKMDYTDKADHVTIKEVVEREAAPASEPVKKAVSASKDEEKPLEVPINSVEPNPDQPRTNFNREELSELAASISKDGLLQPIVVRDAGNGTYQIIAGERRWQACKLLGMAKVPVRIMEADDNRAIELALIENIQRSDLNPIEEAYGYRRMMERCNMTQSEVAKAVSKGRSTIANALRLLELPQEAQELLFEGKITAGHARAILSVPTEEGKKKLTEKIIDEKLSVRDTENLARLLSGRNTKSTSSRPKTPDSFKRVARALRESLDTNVRVKSVKGKNKIEIEFKDEEDLERLFNKLSASTPE